MLAERVELGLFAQCVLVHALRVVAVDAEATQVEAVVLVVVLRPSLDLLGADGIQHDEDDDRNGHHRSHQHPNEVHDVRQTQELKKRKRCMIMIR